MAASDEPLEQFLAWHEREGRPEYTAVAGESVYSMTRLAFYAGYAAATAPPRRYLYGALDEPGLARMAVSPEGLDELKDEQFQATLVPFPAPGPPFYREQGFSRRESSEIGPAHPDYSPQAPGRADLGPLEHVDTVRDGNPGQEGSHGTA